MSYQTPSMMDLAGGGLVVADNNIEKKWSWRNCQYPAPNSLLAETLDLHLLPSYAYVRLQTTTLALHVCLLRINPMQG